jgi:dihydroorotase
MKVYLKVFTENAIPLTRLSEMASLAPAKRLGLQAGLLLPGYPADVTILSVSEETIIQKDHMRSRSHNTPFDGWHVRGRVQTTIVEGEARYEYEKIG